MTVFFTKVVSFLFKIYKVLYIYNLNKSKNIFIKGGLNLKSIPIIDIRNNAQLIIGNNVTLNSNNKGYHLNMHSPVKFLADREGAVISIGSNTRINGACIHAWKSVTIGENCLIAANCQIMDSNGHELSFPDVENRIFTQDTPKEIEIDNNVWIGANTLVLPGVKIGEGSVISANSVVIKDIPSMVVAGGNPAVIIKRIKASD